MKRIGRHRKKARKPGWWAGIKRGLRRRIVLALGAAMGFLSIAAAAVFGWVRLEEHVNRLLRDHEGGASIHFVDLPHGLLGLAGPDLDHHLQDLADRSWMDPDLCQIIAQTLDEVGWISSVVSVQRRGAGRIEVLAKYRIPFALVQVRDDYYLVDREGVRLPGTYSHDARWMMIRGVSGAAPEPGIVWPGEDLKAALSVAELLEGEPYARQITTVHVENYRGRRHPRAANIELATDREGGRIRWGSAPGEEIEENHWSQKLEILRANFMQAGRADGNHPVIDIAIFPDRFIIPG